MNKDFIKATFKDGDFSIDINISLEEETIWMTQKEIASVFETSSANISALLKALISVIESNSSVIKFYLTTAQDGKRYNTKIYNLEIITLLSYKVRSKRAPIFIAWANKTIEELKAKQEKEINESYDNVLHSNKNEIVKFKDGDKEIYVNFSPEENTVWLTQKDIATLFDISVPNLSIHISNILECEEFDDSVVKENLITASDGKKYNTRLYSLDMIEAIGFRVNTKRGIYFRKWARSELKRLILERAKRYYGVVPVNEILEIKEELQEINNSVTILNQKYIDDNNKLFFKGNEQDAYALLVKIINQADNDIVIIDSYIDNSIFTFLNIIKKGVKCKLITSSKHKLSQENLNNIKTYYENVTMYINDDFHDRYVISDYKKVYSLGGSIKDLPSGICSILEIYSDKLIKELNDYIINTFK